MSTLGKTFVARTMDGLKHHNTLVLADVHYEVWVRAFDTWCETPLEDMPYELSGPLPGSEIICNGSTDSRGDLRQRYLPCGDYSLVMKALEGRAIVSARCMEDIESGSGESDEQSQSWPDAVRVKGAEPVMETETNDDQDEPGKPLPHELLKDEPEYWPESDEQMEGMVDFDPGEFEYVTDDMSAETPP